MAQSRIKVLSDVEGVVAHLGGKRAVARLTGRVPSAVHNWIALGRFPARVYDLMIDELHENHADAPPALWGQEQRNANAA